MVENKIDEKKSKRIIEVVPYNAIWKNDYESEAKKIKNILKDIIIDIYHIGSTSISGIKAKPIIDILVEVEDINKVDNYNDKMELQNYIPRGENGIKGRRYFRKGQPQHTHHVHIFEAGNEEIERHINFRDYLNSHPQEAKRYSLIKEELAEKFRFDGLKYTDGKNDFIKEIDKKARIWKFEIGNDV